MKALPTAPRTKADHPSWAPFREKGSRDDVVAAQYKHAEAAAGYADSHEGSGPAARYFHSRIHLITQALADTPGGEVLDVGCGPGMMVRELLDSRPSDFRITAIDRAPAMVDACAIRAAGAENVRAMVGRVESMPFTDASFDVVLAMGVLEYSEAGNALVEISRVTRPNGLVLVTMLNPLSPYRFVEWRIYWPLLRLLRLVETLLKIPSDKRHGPRSTGIRAYTERTLRKLLAAAGLQVTDAAYFDVTLLFPPIDRVVRRWAGGWRKRPERTVSRRRWRRWLGTGYLLVAAKQPHAP